MLITMHKIDRIYQKGIVNIVALQHIDLTIAKGEFLAIMGPSGSGKSTLLHLLGCLDRPSCGTYQLDGVELATLQDARLSLIRNQNIGFIFQSFHLLPHYSVLQNIESPLLYAPPGKNSSKQRRLFQVQEIAERVGLGQRLQHRPSELSGGEMQRVAIARALITHPRVILADEPTGNLDSKTGQEIMNLLQDLHQHGHTVIVVTHETSVAACAERIIHLKDGQIEHETITTRTRRAERGKQKAESSREEAEENLPSADSLLSMAFCRLPSVCDTAVKGILLHKLRSFLSILGIVFGIGAIIAMLAIGAGAKQEILEQLAVLGTSNISVKAISPSEEQIFRGREQLSQGLTGEDVERLSRISPFILALAPLREIALPVQYQQEVIQADIIGTTPEYQQTANLRSNRGDFLPKPISAICGGCVCWGMRCGRNFLPFRIR